MAAEIFAFDDFFVDASDPGVEHTVMMTDRNGNEREVVITTKRALTLGDREASKSAATTTHVDPTGRLVVDGFDSGEFTIQLLSRAVTRWPFVRQGASGQSVPVPVTVVNLRQIMSENADALANLVNEIAQGPTKEALAPFERPSGEAS